jgi:hypothetical protein
MRVLLSFFILLALSAPAAAGKKSKEEEKPPEMPGLTGAKILRCDAGYYGAGNSCKPARPGTYVVPGTNYPVVCPKGTTSPAASRSPGECQPITR